MERKEEKIIMYDSPEAATPYTLAGWIDIERHFHQREEQARYASHTHSKCECGGIAKRGYVKCEDCRRKAQNERYMKMPFKEWDGKTPVTIFMGDEDDYFFGEDDLLEKCADREINPEDLQLVICQANPWYHINEDYWEDIMPSNGDGDLPESLKKKLKELNAFIDTLPAASWGDSEVRTQYKTTNP